MLIPFIVFALLAGFFYVFTPHRFIYDYRLTETAVEVALFGRFPLVTIPFVEITGIERVGRFPISALSSFGFLNRPFHPGVVIQKNGPFFVVLPSRIYLTPKNRDRFYDDVKAVIGKKSLSS